MTNEPDFKKAVDGLLPAIIQDDHTGKVLMQGYMNKESFQKTLDEKVVWFYSRSKQRLWKKGETSGNELQVSTVRLDCDLDSILIKVIPLGPVCHTGADTCFNEINTVSYDWIKHLEAIIEQRQKSGDSKSYVASLFEKGINKIAQKVGEEAVEVVIEAKDDNEELFLNESADLLFHYLILLKAKGYELNDVLEILKSREK
ncbi:MAG: bifunctional phosphoribosyl-AMP cyclohydrolase/phosphoribosyl-ATP diphosphatase HisIE [Flavobacteriaceae bacterium]|jgi:phosphoribosyl-ATP pyrophosphohydrolase/phosphoribosyl-AMP cyclohydrolase